MTDPAAPVSLLSLALSALEAGEDAPDDGAPAIVHRRHTVQIHDVATTWWVRKQDWARVHVDLAHLDDAPARGITTPHEAYAVFCDCFSDVVCFNGDDVGDTARVVDALIAEGIDVLRSSPLRYADAVDARIRSGESPLYFYDEGGGILPATAELACAFLGEDGDKGEGVADEFGRVVDWRFSSILHKREATTGARTRRTIRVVVDLRVLAGEV